MNLTGLLAQYPAVRDELRKVKSDIGLGSRRNLLFGAGSVLAAMWADDEAVADPATFSPERWLVDRITMGRTTEELNLATSLGYANYLEYHLNHTAINDSAMDTRLSSYTTLSQTMAQLIPQQIGVVATQLIEATILRAAMSKRQLFERLVEFWTDHFNIDISTDRQGYLKNPDDRDVIRANALGTFPVLLAASAHSPAMLHYLNNDTNISGNPNENYARELLELHTVSVNGGYTQQDVSEVARCFTGWQISNANPPSPQTPWGFFFNAARHDNAAKVVLGHPIPANGGINDGNTVLNILATHPNTARFIATKLCKRFWSYDPPQSLIDAVTTTYTNTGGDIKAMLRTIFNTITPNETVAPLKYKRPYHQLISGLRATNATINAVASLRTQLTAMGQLPFGWGPPDGYPDAIESWVGLILPRWNFGALAIRSSGGISGVVFDSNAFYTGLPGTPTADDIVNRIDERLFGGQMATNDKNRVKAYVAAGTINDTRRRDAVGLAIASPGFQWY